MVFLWNERLVEQMICLSAQLLKNLPPGWAISNPASVGVNNLQECSKKSPSPIYSDIFDTDNLVPKLWNKMCEKFESRDVVIRGTRLQFSGVIETPPIRLDLKNNDVVKTPPTLLQITPHTLLQHILRKFRTWKSSSLYGAT